MYGEQIWDNLIAECKDRSIKLKTSTGLNFILSFNGKELTVHPSELGPSIQLKQPRSINKDNFEKVFLYYERWAAGERGVRKKITAISVNSAYILAAINYMLSRV